MYFVAGCDPVTVGSASLDIAFRSCAPSYVWACHSIHTAIQRMAKNRTYVIRLVMVPTDRISLAI